MTRRTPTGRVRSRPLTLACGVACGLLAAGCQRGSAPATTPTAVLKLSSPATIAAGEVWTIALPDGPIAVEAQVSIIGAWGARTLRDDLTDGAIAVPGEFTRRSGTLIATVATPDAGGEVRVAVTPGAAVDGAIPLAGPRSMTADGAHRTMVVALPVDEFGNAVADGTPVSVFARRPDGTLDSYGGEVHGLLAAIDVPSRTAAGQTALRLDISGATGPQVDVSEVPGPPAGIGLEPVTVPLRADGRELLTLRTTRLVDRFGNLLLDGTAATLSVDGPTGAGLLHTVTIGGVATFHLEAADSPGAVRVQVEVAGVTGDPATLHYSAAVDDVPTTFDRSETGAVLTVGPVRSDLGSDVPDGTRVTIRRDAVVVATGQLLGGRASFDLDIPVGTELDVEVLGIHRRVEAP